MPTYEVDVGGKTYEVDAPDPNTAWQWANYTNKNQPEEPGFLERAKIATKRGFEQIPESAAGISMGIKAALGMKPEAGAQAEQIRQEAQRQSMETPGITFEELQKTYGKDGAIEMLKKLPTYVAEQILSNAPSMAVPLAVGAGAGAISGPLAPIVAPVAGIGTYGLQQFGQFMRRQAEEGRTGQTLEPGTAALAAGLTAPIGYFADRFTLGLGNIPEKILGKEIAAELAKRTGQSVAGRAATGATVGVIAEAPTEVLEQAAERWQAGLSLTNEDAKREYMEAAAGAAAVGGVGGAATRALRRPGEAPAPEITVPEMPPTQAPAVTPEVTSVPASEAQDTSAMMREVEALLAGKVAQEEPVSKEKPVEPKVTPTPVTPPEISTSGTEMVNLPPAEPTVKAEPTVAEEPKEPEIGKPVAPADAIVFKTSGGAHDYAIKNNVPGIVVNTDKGYALDVGDVEPQYVTAKPAEPAKPAEIALPETKPTVAEAPKAPEVKAEEQLPDDKTRVLNALKKDNENTAQFILERAISVANEANKPVNVFSHEGQIKRQVEGMPLPKYARMIGKIQPEPDYEFQTNANTRAQAPAEEVTAPEVKPAETPVVETPTAEVSATEETKAPESIQVLMRLQDVAYQEKAPKDPELKSWLSDNGLIEVEGEKAKITPVGKKLLERLNPVGLSAPRVTTEEAANIIKEFTRSNRPTPRVEPPVAAPKVEPIKEPVAPEIKAETPAPEKKLTYLEPVQSLERSIEIANEYVNKFNQGDFKKPSRYSASSSAKVSEKDAVRQMNTDQDFAYNKAAKEFLEGDLTAKVPSKKQDKIDVVRTGYLPLKDISPKPIEKGIVSRAPTDNVGQRRALSYIINDKDIRTYLRGVHVDPKKGVMVATDGHRLATLNKANFEGLPPNPQGYTVIDAKNNWIEGKYPDYERVTPKQHFGNKMRVDAAPMGDYARGVTRAAKYVEEKYPAVRLKIGDQVTGVNPEYLAEMTDMFRRFGYSSFDISSSDKQIFASSPDGKLLHVVMPISKPSEVFAAYEPKESTGKELKKPIAPKPVKAEAEEVVEKITTPAEEAADIDNKSVRDKLKQIASNLKIDVFETSDGQYKASKEGYVQIPSEDKIVESAESPDHVFAHELGHAVIQKRGLYFNGIPKDHLSKLISNWDSLKKISKEFRPAVYASTDPKIRRHANKNDEVLADVLGAFFLGKISKADIKPLMDGVGLNDFDLGIEQTKAEAKPAVKPAEELTTAEREKEIAQLNADIKRLSLEQIRSRDEVREAEIDEEMKPITARLRELQGKKAEPKKEEPSPTGLSSREIAELNAELVQLEADFDKAIGPQKDVIQDDINSIRDMLGLPLENVDPEFISNDTTGNFIADRQELIRKYQSMQQKIAGIHKKFAQGKAGLREQREVNELKAISDEMKAQIDVTKQKRTDAKNFFARATKEWNDNNISDDVYSVFKMLYEKYPSVLEGLNLSVKKRPEDSNAAGQFYSFSRLVRLYKGTVGVENASTARHEITHSLEQMMTPEAAVALVDDWSAKLEQAIKRDQSPKAQKYFQGVLEFFADPSVKKYREVQSLMPSYDYYQYINPSEYWAVNAESLMERQLGSGWDKFVMTVKRLYEGLKYMFGFDNKYRVHQVFNDIMSGEQKRITKKMLTEYVEDSVTAFENIDPEAVNTRRNILGHPAPLSVWDAPEQSKLSDWDYRWIDKHTDTKNVVKKVNEAIGEVEDRFDPYLKETLYHGRSTEATLEFAKNEFRPLIEKMGRLGVRLDEFQNYLHNRHAPRYNEIIDERNDNPDIAGRGSGIETEKAEKYMADLAKNNPELKAKYESLAKDVDAIVKGTQDILVNSGLETKERIASWRKMSPDYVPLKRDPTELDFVNPNFGVGKGFAVSGDFSRSSTGSLKTVVDILNNIAVQRELAISRAERARVGAALYGLAIKAPNPNFWMPINPDAVKDLDKLKQELMDMGLSKDDAENIFEQPRVPTLDKKSNQVKLVVNRMMLRNENVFPVRINGKDRFIIFNPGDPVALRMVKSLKNLDANQLSNVLGTMAEATRLIAAMNTQYNPVFGAWNFARDLGGAAINLSSTPIANKRFEVISGAVPALRAIYRQLRGKPPRNEAEKKLLDLERRFAKGGGKTGYKEQFARADNRASLVERELKRIDRTNFRKAADAVSDWLSDYNDAMENAVRLSAFKVALESGVSEERALEIAKNLTVNFNRKGAWTSNVNAFYAFFNASVQGTARLAQVIFSKDSKGNVRLTKAGKKIFAGGMALGAMQALVLAVAGFDSDEPPEFLKNKNLIIPTTGGNYLIVPMPLGFNVFPNVGRLITEYALTESGAMTGKRDLPKTLQSVVAAITDAFNPLGSSGLIQTMSPTLVDPFAALATNKDAFGRPISKENRATNPTPGYERSRDNATALSQGLAYGINYLTGGGKYGIGMWSPTADDIDYFAGQYMGGLGREIVKAGRFAAAKTEGEETPPYKVPILGKLYGETETPSAVTDKFYKNVTMLAELEGEMKRMREKHADTSEFREENPEYRYIKSANNLENQITKINKTIKELHKREETPEIKERIERLKEQKTRMMNSFNERIKNLQRE